MQDIQGWSWQKDYVYRRGSLLAAVVPRTGGGEETQHFHLDHLGTPRLKTDGLGAAITSHKYLPYGEELTTPSLDNEVMQFTSHERDRTPTDWDNDLDYMHARYYAPKFGRFLSLDPVGGKTESPQRWNRYAYVSGNPILKLDPNGRDEFVFIWSPTETQIGHGAFGVQLLDDYGRPDGRLEIRHLWPADPVGKSRQADADYRTEIVREADRKKFEGGEGRVADGIIRISGDAKQDAKALQVLERMEGNATYQVPDNTCSTYCAAAVESTGTSVNQSGSASVFIHGIKAAEQDGVITPVAVYNSIVDSGDPRVFVEVPLEDRDPNIEIK